MGIINFFGGILGTPLGFIFRIFYDLFKNYGLALLLFTLIMKLIMLPLNIKQQKSSAKMQSLKPKQDEINRKYKGDKQKINEELMKLYQEEKYSPTSGCLPMLIQFPVMFGLIAVIYQPLTYIINVSADLITKATELFGGAQSSITEILIIGAAKTDPSAYSFLPSSVFTFDFTFLGIDLSLQPDIGNFSWLWLIPILSGATQLLSTLITNKTNPYGNSMGKSMGLIMIGMPLFFTWLTFSFPAALGVYWIFTNILTIIQTWALNVVYHPYKVNARSEFSAYLKRKKAEDEIKSNLA